MFARVTPVTMRAGFGNVLAAALCLGTLALGASARPVVAHEAHGHPARIHEGSCENLGAVAFRLNGVGGSVDLDNAPVATPAPVNPDAAYQVMLSETAIEGTLDDFLAADHALMVYESDEAMDAIACGNIGGLMSGETLITALAESGLPGHVGFATFAPSGDQILVMVIIGHALAPVSASSGTPQPRDGMAAEAAPDAAAGEDADHAHADEGDHHEEEEAHDAAATPEA